MSKKKVKLGLIGKGLWGKNYIRSIATLPDCELASDCIKTRDYTDLFSKDIDGVIIATPALTHFSIASQFLKNGYNVLIEKPLTTNYKDALQLAHIAGKARAVAMVGHVYRYHPAVNVLKQLLPQIGKIYYIRSESMDLGPIRKDVSALWDWAPHDLSLFLDLFGEKPKSLSAWGLNFLGISKNLYDMCELKLIFSNRRVVLMSIGWLSPVKKRSLSIVGDKGALLFDDVRSDEKVRLVTISGKVRYPSYDNEPPLILQIKEFLDCIRKRRIPKTDISEGVLVTKIIEAAEESIRFNGKEVHV